MEFIEIYNVMDLGYFKWGPLIMYGIPALALIILIIYKFREDRYYGFKSGVSNLFLSLAVIFLFIALINVHTSRWNKINLVKSETYNEVVGNLEIGNFPGEEKIADKRFRNLNNILEDEKLSSRQKFRAFYKDNIILKLEKGIKKSDLKFYKWEVTQKFERQLQSNDWHYEKYTEVMKTKEGRQFISPDGKYVFNIQPHNIRIYENKSYQKVSQISIVEDNFMNLPDKISFNSQKNLLAIVTSNKLINIYDIKNGDLVHKINITREDIEEVREYELVWSWRANLDRNTCKVGFSPDGKYLATLRENDYVVRIWEVDSWEQVGTVGFNMENRRFIYPLDFFWSHDSEAMAVFYKNKIRIYSDPSQQ